ncbi:uncharacterized protein [Magallana gigas]|uniref:uncharacterized protein isoform X1 n=1 Tax=Magallana gigas TaxID=29159 RepID=UPI0033412695
MKFLLPLLCVGIVFAANHHGLTLDQISTMIIGNMDKNADGNITVEEIDTEFVTNYDHDGDGCVTMHEFTHQWNLDYHDDHHASEGMFHHLDITTDGCLKKDDLGMHHMAMDTNNDNTVTGAEFTAWLHHVHPDSAGHGHHGR